MSTAKENMPSELNESVIDNIDEKATIVAEQEGQEKTSTVKNITLFLLTLPVAIND